MTVRHSDVEFDFDDPDEGWFGMARPADVETAPPVVETTPDQWTRDADNAPEHTEMPVDHEDLSADTDRWFVQDVVQEMALAAAVEREDPAQAKVDDRPVTQSVAATLNVVPTNRNGFVKASAASSWEARLSNSGAWDFTARSTRTRFPSRSVMVAVAAIIGAGAVVGIFLGLRGPAAPAVDGSTPVPPSQSATPSAPTTSAPAPVANVPLPSPLLPPPPPPPPSAEQLSPPVVTRQYTPQYQAPDPPRKPQTNVTRAPMSATPPSPPPPPRNSATPGDSPKRGFFH
ncbi:hypothetical protein [Mycolicibacterium hodleri]|uniref:hypothetical protein n=1 Tax=Mycolicibacterium hodleri TaxID=49897 RepID=UPI0013755FA8|nr:hypothetical protein [Mycolicibacterium hodleri]